MKFLNFFEMLDKMQVVFAFSSKNVLPHFQNCILRVQWSLLKTQLKKNVPYNLRTFCEGNGFSTVTYPPDVRTAIQLSRRSWWRFFVSSEFVHFFSKTSGPCLEKYRPYEWNFTAALSKLHSAFLNDNFKGFFGSK